MTEFEKLPGIGGKRLTECGKILFVFRQGRETGSTVSDLQISIGLCAEIDDLLPGKRLQGIFIIFNKSFSYIPIGNLSKGMVIGESA